MFVVLHVVHSIWIESEMGRSGKVWNIYGKRQFRRHDHPMTYRINIGTMTFGMGTGYSVCLWMMFLLLAVSPVAHRMGYISVY